MRKVSWWKEFEGVRLDYWTFLMKFLNILRIITKCHDLQSARSQFIFNKASKFDLF